MASVDPYLMFDGNCEEAFDFYKSVFGGEFLNKSRYKEAPATEMPIDPSEGDKIMHVALPIGKNNMLMASDQPKAYGPVSFGNGYHITFSPDSQEEANRVFSSLAEGGQVFQPLEKTFWGAYYGSLKDKFGVQWMVNYQIDQQP